MFERGSSRRAASATAAWVAVVGLALAACDTGDGKTLRNTVTPTTQPPPDTEPLESVPVDGAGAIENTFPSVTADSDPETFTVVAPWLDGGTIDALYTCDGDDLSPALSWQGVPPGTVQLALVVLDEDATIEDTPFVHWVVAGIAPDDISIIEGSIPDGAIEAVNSFGEVGWGGPCPPEGDEAHTYRFVLHALAQQVELANALPAAELLDYLGDITFARAETTGTYAR
jgi:Raf kinase inhibitor-like YbhB/YbcL family protein